MQRTGRTRGRTNKLSYVGVVLVSAALLFAAWSGLRATFPSSSSVETPSVDAGSSTSRTGKISRLLRFEGIASRIGTVACNATAVPCKCDQVSSVKTTQLPIIQTTQLKQVAKPNPRLYHTVTTTQGFANHWQARIHYFHFKKQRSLCQQQEQCDMGGFTRLLHSGEADDLFDEIPTVVVSPLPKGKDSGYVVLNRPFAFLTWLKVASIPERYILMGEGDHIFLKPLPNMMVGEAPAAFFFTYMVPEQYPAIVRKFLGPITDEELKLVPRIGNSPTFVSVKDMQVVAPFWFNTTNAIFEDKEAHTAWSWVLEMYGFSLATFQAGIHKNMKLSTDLMAHPPFDKVNKDFTGSEFYLLHYTYPLNFGPAGNMTEKPPYLWQFDKRKYMTIPPPRHMEEPPAAVECLLARTLIQAFNEATDGLPCWDEYVATQKVTTTCTPSVNTVVKASVA